MFIISLSEHFQKNFQNDQTGRVLQTLPVDLLKDVGISEMQWEQSVMTSGLLEILKDRLAFKKISQSNTSEMR